MDLAILLDKWCAARSNIQVIHVTIHSISHVPLLLLLPDTWVPGLTQTGYSSSDQREFTTTHKDWRNCMTKTKDHFHPICFKYRVRPGRNARRLHSTKKPVTTMLTYPWKCTVLHCNHLGNTWKPLVLMTRHFDYCPSASKGDNQSARSSAPVVSRCFPGGYNVKLYISRGRLAWWLLAFLHSATHLI